MLTVALAAAAIDLILIAVKGVQVDLPAYGAIVALVAGLMAVGALYRCTGRSQRIGAATTCAALFIFFSLCLSTFNTLLLPLWREPIDVALQAADRMFGYHWPTLIEWAGRHPFANAVLKFAYMSTIPQFAALVVILGFAGRLRELHVLLTAVTLTATFSICFWGLFPSFGPTVLYDLPAAVEALAAPVVDTAYGDHMAAMGQNGPGLISPKQIKGLIAFPSYHVVLAIIAIYAARSVRWLFPGYLVLNLLIMPGIFFHGGHHLVDLPAGLTVAIFGIWLARRIVYRQYEEMKAPPVLAE